MVVWYFPLKLIEHSNARGTYRAAQQLTSRWCHGILCTCCEFHYDLCIAKRCHMSWPRSASPQKSGDCYVNEGELGMNAQQRISAGMNLSEWTKKRILSWPTSFTARMSPVVFFILRNLCKKYQNLDLAATSLSEKSFIRYNSGSGSFSVGVLRPTTMKRHTWTPVTRWLFSTRYANEGQVPVGRRHSALQYGGNDKMSVQ